MKFSLLQTPIKKRLYWTIPSLKIYCFLIILIVVLSSSLVFGVSMTKANKLDNKAMTYVKQGRYKEALPLFLEAYYMDPSNQLRPYSIGRCYAELGECQKAKLYFEKAFAHPYSLPQSANEKAREYIISVPCSEKEDPEIWEKRADSQKLISQGIELQITNQADEALKKYYEAVNLYPSIEAYLRIAQIFFLNQDYCGAMRESVKLARELQIDEEFFGFMIHLDEAILTCPKPTLAKEKAVISELEAVKTPPKSDQNNETDIGLTNNKKELKASTYWGIGTGSVALVSIALSIVVYVRSSDLQERFDQEIDRGRFDETYVENLAEALDTNEILFNVFLWSGAALGITSLVLFLLPNKTEVEKISFRPLMENDSFGISAEFTF